jgi:hypothetical protein
MESKAPLGRVTVGLKSLSQLYVAAVHVESQDPNYPAAWNAARSRKLRRKALLSFLEPAFENPTSHVPRLDERPPKRPFALNMRVAKEVDGKEVDGKEVDGKEVDHIIIPFGSVSDEQGIIKVLGDLPDLITGVTKTQKRAAGGNEEAIRCRVDTKAITTHYWKSLDVLIRTLATERNSTSHQVAHQFLESFHLQQPEMSKIEVEITSGNVPSTGHKSRYQLRLRSRMTVDSVSKAMHFDYDLVPVIPAKRLSEVVIDILGPDVAAVDGTLVAGDTNCPAMRKVDQLSMLKHKLCRLNVRCAYLPQRQNPLGAPELFNHDSISSGRQFQVKDVRFAQPADTFSVGDTVHTVQSYFEQGKINVIDSRGPRSSLPCC